MQFTEDHKLLPAELKEVVRNTIELLGQAIRAQYGETVYRDVERIRALYKHVRDYPEKAGKAHKKTLQSIADKKPAEKFQIAHSFTIGLELINCCENAYRTHRLRVRKQNGEVASNEDSTEPVIFVLTAHPTEVRSPECIRLLSKISKLLLSALSNTQPDFSQRSELYHLIHLLIKIPMSKTKSPTVADEANYIYSVLFQPENVEQLGQYLESGQPVFIRTWVGGDKDGHPGVHKTTMLESLSLSRKQILTSIKQSIESGLLHLDLVQEDNKDIQKLAHKIKGLEEHVRSLTKIKDGDGLKISRFHKTLDRLVESYQKVVGTFSPDLKRIQSLLNMFPGLVVPLELREDSAVIMEACSKPRLPIAQMLWKLKAIAKGGKCQWYARGFVISMCESAEDMQNATQLMKKHLGGLHIPVIPLFETRQALDNSSKITKEILTNKVIEAALETQWDKKFEVMLGYSDSAKESGAFYSRVMIQKTLIQLDKAIRGGGYTPIFFHGSGGSVARGGGSIEEQVSWWPNSARRRFKATVQGEMIYRSFSSPEILDRQIEKIRTGVHKKKFTPETIEHLKPVRKFADLVSEKYLAKVSDPEFLEVVQKATPYPYLDQLKIGSRPSKRKDTFTLKSLRAIPWVLCWTQTRVLFPVWWGIGSCWKDFSTEEKQKLKTSYQESDLFRSYIKLLAFTLQKVEISIWKLYLEQSGIDEKRIKEVEAEFQSEFDLCKEFVTEITGESDLLWYRPWLGESIRLRSTMIHPLNILEIDAIQRQDVALLRECVTGVASGMLTTG